MRVDCALLCDAVTVREGLLQILGGGITRLGRSAFPAPLNAALALRVTAHVSEAGKPRALEVLLLDEDGDTRRHVRHLLRGRHRRPAASR